MKPSFTALAVSLLSALCMSCTSSPRDIGDDTLSVLFTGDVLLDRGARPVIERRGIGYLLQEVEPYFRQADAVVVNLECPLTDSLSPLNKQYIFRADASWAADLYRTGITHAALANNHTIDQGRRGLQATWQHLVEADIVPLGYGCSAEEQLEPAVVRKEDLRVALFNAVTLPIENWYYAEGRPGICQPTATQLSDAVGRYRAAHPETAIVVVLHWGTEFQTQPSMSQRRLARSLADAGADAIVGHHPHVLQPIDTLGHTLVCYSLGNFVFDQRPPQTRRGMMLRLRFRPRTPVAFDTIPVEVRQCRPCP